MAQQVFCSTKVSKEGAEMIEKHTRLQRECMEWHNQRRGRLTASVFHDVFRHKQGNTVLLVSRLLKPNDLTTLPGVLLMKARQETFIYTQKMASTHTNFECHTSGLVVNPSYSFLGASPDGVMLCGCCGEGIVEIKCPCSIKDHDPNTCRGKPKFFLMQRGLCTTHTNIIHMQVQGQLTICDKQFCDFIVWTTNGLFIQRICRDRRFWLKLSP